MPAAPTTVFAVLGHPVAGNPTGEMIDAACEAAGIPARYLTIDVAPERLADAVAGVRALGFVGLHLTVPHKIAVIGLLDRLTPAAAAIQAVNCVKREGDALVGDNTDGRGFVESLRAVADPQGLHVAVIGAGGAARAVAVETALAGAAGVTVANRSAERGAELARIVTVATGVPARFAPLCDGLEVSSEIDVVVNATSVGMGAPGHAVPIDWSHARAGVVAADVVIDPRTLFLAQAEEAGARTLDGLGMLVEQAAIGLRWWTGVEPDRTVMRAALADAMQLAP